MQKHIFPMEIKIFTQGYTRTTLMLIYWSLTTKAIDLKTQN